MRSTAAVLAVVDQMVRSEPLETLLWLDLRARVLSEWRHEWYWASDVTPARVRALAPGPASQASIPAASFERRRWDDWRTPRIRSRCPSC
jgi:hypothetical protein